MAENRTQNPKNQNDDMQELLAMLDRMQNRPRVQEVEDALIQQGRPDLVRMDVYTAPTAQDGFVPTVSNNNLADLLITPEEEPMLLSQPAQPRVEDEKVDAPLLYGEETAEEDWEQLPPPPEKKQNPIKVLLGSAKGLLPGKGDGPLQVLTKSGFWLGLLALCLATVLLVQDMKVEPAKHRALHQELLNMYQSTTDVTVGDIGTYPEGMLASFKQLYDRNPQVKGWLSFHAEGKDFLNIEYPFVQGEDNRYYQTHDYDGNASDYGTLYVDAQARIEGYNDADKVLVIHSNSTPDQSMLSSVTRLVGPVDYARAVPELTLSTLYRRDIYYVFAMALVDGSGKDPFQPIQTTFADEDGFLQYIQSLGARSLFDYPVDVTYDDSIVLLSVPTGPVSTGLTEGRIIVGARRRRPGEISVQANEIMKNKDAIMPYSWYTSRGKTLHPFFYSGEEPTEETTAPNITIPTILPENPHGNTTSTTGDTGNVGGTVINKDPNATGDPTPSVTESTTNPTTPSGVVESEPTGTAPTESGVSESTLDTTDPTGVPTNATIE